jgi:antitoxin ParD1/3/4
MTSMNFSLPEPMRQWVEAQVAAGEYGNVSEYMRELIRRDQREKAQRKLEELLLAGLQSGDPIEVTPEYWEKKRKTLLEKYGKRAEES